ncbi:XRE family transcriptional regulator [Streptomyces sp. NBC_01511]|uniref:XRE family transcriptional regulator n=1 Tax=Streptomyces sp. NBC_01511 TaxID=2903889 RepID=UPI00386C1C52
MPRWKALPEELDPQVREFATQLRRLVDKSGLSIAAVADRTGYSKTSWERYLNGRLLAPKGAIVALAEVTGTNPLHLTTMWELSERAWSRSEMRHDMTMEAIRISQARDALGEFGGDVGPGRAGASRPGGRTATPPGPGAGPGGVPGARTGPHSGAGTGAGTGPGPAAGAGAGPHAPGGPDAPAGSGGSGGWLGPEYAGANRPPTGVPSSAPSGSPDQGSGSGGRGGSGRRRTTIFVAALVGALLVIAAAVLLTDLGGGGDGKKSVAESPSAKPTTSAPELPAGVKCAGGDCTGEDPELMGCGGEFAETSTTVTVGTAVVEVRYSETCGAAWARVTEAAPGDTVEIAADRGEGKPQTGTVNGDKDAYTPMVAVATADEAKACATLTTGVEGCTPAGE